MNARKSTCQLVNLFALLLIALVPTASPAVTWVNETNLASEADYDNLQFPSSISAQANTFTNYIYGRVYEAGLTEAAGPAGSVLADVGYGPLGSDPRTNNSWVWTAAVFNVQIGNDDEYQQQILAPIYNGTYSYTYRFSVDNGATYTAADLDGAGSNPGLVFNPNNLGQLTVTDGLNAPEPGCVALLAIAAGLLAGRRTIRV
jgi:hypothetical protein